MQIHVVPFLRTERVTGLRGVVVAGIQHGVVRQPGQGAQAGVHVLRVAARQIDAAARVDEQRVAGDQPVLDQEALRARGVAGSVDERDAHVAHVGRVAAVHRHHVRVGQTDQTGEELRLGTVNIDFRLDLLQQLDDAGDVGAKQVAAEMVLVVVGDECLGDREAVALRGVDDFRNVPCGIDDRGFARCRVPDQIREVLHRADFHLFEIRRRVGHRPLLIFLDCSANGTAAPRSGAGRSSWRTSFWRVAVSSPRRLSARRHADRAPRDIRARPACG